MYINVCLQFLNQNKRLKKMGSRVLGVSHTVMLLGGGENGILVVILALSIVGYGYTHFVKFD